MMSSVGILVVEFLGPSVDSLLSKYVRLVGKISLSDRFNAIGFSVLRFEPASVEVVTIVDYFDVAYLHVISSTFVKGFLVVITMC